MIEYARFLLKRVLCKKSNVFLIIVSTLLLSGILVMNIRTQNELRNSFDEQIETNNGGVDEYKNKLANVSVGSKKYQQYKSELEFLESNTQTYKRMITYYDNEEWSLFYKTYTSVLEDQIAIITSRNDTQGEEETKKNNSMLSFFNNQLEYIKYLDENNLEYEDKNFPIFGLSFITSVSQRVSPIVILICCIYILAQIFTMDYSKGIDTSKLLPIGKTRTYLVKISVAILVSVFIFLSILLCTFLIATLLTSNTGMGYPLMIQDSGTNTWIATSLNTFVKEWLVIGILFCICFCFFTYVLSLFIKEEGALFLVTLCLIIGLAYMPKMVDFLSGIAHLLPTTYMSFVSVVNGKTAVDYGNSSITFTSGVLVLSFFIVLQLVICLIKVNIKRQKI